MYTTHTYNTRGFTFIELLVVVAILAVFSAVSLYTFRQVFWSAGERVAAQEVVEALRYARAQSVAARGDTTYGVRIATSSVTRFVGTAYNPTHASNTVYFFEAGATATGTLVHGAVDIVFARRTGIPSATGTLFIVDARAQSTSTITIQGTGLVE